MAIALEPELIQRLKSTASEQQSIELDVELVRGVAALSLVDTHAPLTCGVALKQHLSNAQHFL